MPSLNKICSAKQEKTVADFMGWKVVSGSGSQQFAPGDINSYRFLLECKTHTDVQDTIVFYKKHWVKITEEALSKHKLPALVVDNGTQNVKHTWVMIPRRVIPEEDAFRLFNLVNTARTDSTVTFSHASAADLFRLGHQDNHINFFPEWCNGEQVAIMPLAEFKRFYKDQFEG